jgi:hypothetical protein
MRPAKNTIVAANWSITAEVIGSGTDALALALANACTDAPKFFRQ